MRGLSESINFCSVGERSLSNGLQTGHGARWGGSRLRYTDTQIWLGKWGQKIICLTFDWIYVSIKSFNNCSLKIEVGEKLVNMSIDPAYALAWEDL